MSTPYPPPPPGDASPGGPWSETPQQPGAWTPPPAPQQGHQPAQDYQGPPQSHPGHPQGYHPQPPATFGPGPTVVPRNPLLHALASLLIAGLGTALAGRVGTAIIIFCLVLFTGVLTFIPLLGLLFVPLWLGAWAFSVFHGFRTAKEWNAQRGIIS